MRRILMTADAVGGVWSYAMSLGTALRASGAEVVVAVMGPGLDEARRAEADRAAIDVVHQPYRLEWMDDPWNDVDRAGEWLLGLAEDVDPDLVHLNGYCHAALPWRRPVVVVAHSCVLSWWRAVRGEDAPERYAEYHRRVARGLAGADAVVAPSRAMANRLAEHYGDGGSRPTHVIPNGTRALPEPRRKQRLVLAAGRVWDPAKNLATLGAVASRVSWPIVILGDATRPGGEPVELRGVLLPGTLPRERVAEWMGRASILAHPARYEPFGLAPLEAATAGCALVLGAIPSLREIWGDAAAWVEPDDADGLAAEIEALIADTERRRRLADAARRRAARYTVERMAGAYTELYADLLAPCARPAPSLGSTSAS